MASSHYTGFFVLFWLIYLFITGLSLFSRGFLLKRIVVPTRNTCENGFAEVDVLLQEIGHITGSREVNNCWMPKRFNKSIVILIDALRYDFVKNVVSPKGFHYENKLTVVSNLLRNHSQQCALFKFIADPPTTTMQRLKGLTTGSLPTFIDAGQNFASSEIQEDNIIDQLIANRKKVVFLGDDTWSGLFPNRFAREFPFPSFNVKDLHTVDRGIENHLVPEIKSDGWDVIVAHFLGVDHCGHRYGPNHQAMADKLNEMNELLRSVIENMDDETVLFVMGDHGMTEDGDHGGDSDDEVEAALFVYSKSLQLHSELMPEELRQVDFPPTFALLLGLPIPFGSLGKVLTEMFISPSSRESSFSEAYLGAVSSFINMKQVDTFLSTYLNLSEDIPRNDARFIKLEAWKEELNNLTLQIPNMPSSKHDFVLQRMMVLSTLHVRTVLEMCEEVWAKFDLPTMIGGILLTATAALITFIVVAYKIELTGKASVILFATGIFGFLIHLQSLLSAFVCFRDYETIASISACVTSLVIFLYDTSRARRTSKQAGFNSSGDYLSLMIFLSLTLLRFSNSYVVSEDSVVYFFLFTLIAWEVWWNRPTLEKKKLFEGVKKKVKSVMLSRKRAMILLTFGTMCCLLFATKLFWKCREEQWWCESTRFLQPISSVPREFVNYRNWRLIVSVACVAAAIFSSRWLLRKAGNLNGYSFPVLCFLYSPIVMWVLISLNWILQTFPSNVANNIFPHHHIILPNAVFILAFINQVTYFYNPLLIFNSEESKVEEIGPLVKRDQTEIVHQIYRHLKGNWKKHLVSTTTASGGSLGESAKVNEQPLIVYGLATIFSAPLIAFTTIALLTVIMLSRDGLAPSFLLLVISTAFALHSIVNANDKQDIMCVKNSWILSWFLFSSVGFFATGHQAAFPTIHWESGLIGASEHFHSNILPAIKVLLNTFSSSVLYGVSLPLLMLWPITNRILYEKHHLSSDAEFELKRGEFLFYGNVRFYTSLFQLTAKYMWLCGTQMLSSMVAVALHRRHLMVWKIFAPKFLFESLNFVVTVIALLLTYLLMLRIYRTVDMWMKFMESKRASKSL